MGLAEPKKRRKISHDPRNLAWSSQASSASYGHRLMTQQGWSEGQALGARDSFSSSTKKHKHHSGLATDAERLAAARVGVLFKDDNLGLGAKRKGGGSQNVEDQRTGLDAFQGLLGRLNGKGEDVLRLEEKKVEERRLEMFFKGRWGGMVFVRGGVLLGSDKLDGEKEADREEKEDEDEGDGNEAAQSQDVEEKDDEQAREEKQRRKEEKRQRKEERKKRREEKSLRKATQRVKSLRKIESESEDKDASTSDSTTPATVLPKHKSPITLTPAPDEPVSSPATSDIDIATSVASSKKRKRKSESLSSSSNLKAKSQIATPTASLVSAPATATASQQRNGRHLLRGRNIMAKKMVLSDSKGLDQIFMR